MLLNYLYENYFEKSEFCNAANINLSQLGALESANLTPKASYILEVGLHVKSFIAAHEEQQIYQFYLKGQLVWLKQIEQKNISTENGARHYFETQYNLAIDKFLESDLGQNIVQIYPQTEWDLTEYNAIWREFLAGTYGLCTRTGSPDQIFLKHVYIRFIEFITKRHQPDKIKQNLRDLLKTAVEELDKVESDFAAHEVALSSRQRCIINPRKDYLK
ncbi:MAG: hypothetical protein HRU28_18830 [Rhizobiales bacterium]|nr:hypothetical protein [Hyphomicrobiales bacterium]